MALNTEFPYRSIVELRNRVTNRLLPFGMVAFWLTFLLAAARMKTVAIQPLLISHFIVAILVTGLYIARRRIRPVVVFSFLITAILYDFASGVAVTGLLSASFVLPPLVTMNLMLLGYRRAAYFSIAGTAVFIGIAGVLFVTKSLQVPISADVYIQSPIAWMFMAFVVTATSITFVIPFDIIPSTLATSDQRFRMAFEHAGVGVCLLSPDGKVLVVNNRLYDMLGYSPDTVSWKNFTDILHPDDRNTTLSLLSAAILAPVNVEKRFVHRDGRVMVALVTMSCVEGGPGSASCLIVHIQDVTDRVETHEQLELFKHSIDAHSDGAYWMDRDNRVVYVNEAACASLQYTKAELLGMHLSAINGTVTDPLLQQVWETLRKKGSFSAETIHRRKDESEFPVEVVSTYVRFGDKEYNCGFARDITERKRTDMALSNSEAQLRSIWENSLDGMRLMDTSGHILLVNRAYCALVGLSPEQLIGGSFSVVFSKATRDETLRIFQKRAAAGTLEAYSEGELHLWNDSRVWVAVTNSTVESALGRPLVLSIFRNITDRKRAEDQVARALAWQESIFEGSRDAVFISDEQSRFVSVNQAAVELTGYTKEELLGMRIPDIQNDADRHAYASYHQRILGGEQILSEAKIRRKDGRTIETEFNNRPISIDETPYMHTTARDISGRKRAEEQLHTLSLAVEQSPASIVITDTQGNIEYVNPKFTHITGYPLDEALGKNPRILKSGETTPEEYADLWRSITAGKEWRGIFHNRKKNGELFWEMASVSPVKNRENVITHFVAVKEDITDRRSMEEQVRQMQKMESIGTLAGGIAHDFNNILAIIMGHLSLIDIRKREPEAVGDSIDAMSKAVQRGAGLVRQIMTFARKSDIVLAPVNVNQSIRELAAMLLETFPKTIEVTLSLEKTIPIIAMDHTQLHQALLNLCVNARDAMMDSNTGRVSAGGILGIRSELVEGTGLRKRHREAQAAAYVCVAVSDTGTGMDEKTQKRIFEPFYTTKDPGKGTGLGLAVVYGVIQGHHGLIEVDSAPGKGTTVRLYLPVPDGIIAPAVEHPEADEKVRGGTETILLVEDEVAIAGLMETLLEDRGYRVLRAADGEEAIEVFRSHKDEIALVLSDIGLPKLDGVALFGRLVNIDSHVKVVIASGYVEPSVRAELTRAGARAVITKPYVPGEVLRIVRRVLDGNGSPLQR